MHMGGASMHYVLPISGGASSVVLARTETTLVTSHVVHFDYCLLISNRWRRSMGILLASVWEEAPAFPQLESPSFFHLQVRVEH
jgi:hypothetical protein